MIDCMNGCYFSNILINNIYLIQKKIFFRQQIFEKKINFRK